jgi:hypothetical protein
MIIRKLFLLLLLCGIHIIHAQNFLEAEKSALDNKTAQYGVGYNKCNDAYWQLMNVQLVNKVNLALVTPYKAAVKAWADANFKNYDLSLDANVSTILEYFTRWKTLRVFDEMILLTNLQSEIERIKLKDPDGFYKSDRYYEMQTVLKELESCSPDDINKIAWKHGLVN